jgi:8-oxo-dGTP diphosphatase
MKDRFKCPVAIHLILIKNNEILLLKRKNTGFADGMWGVPSGCVDGNECVTKAMIREAKEETGINLLRDSLQVSSVMHRKASDDWESIAFFFRASEYSGEIENCEPEKCEELRFFPLNNLPKLIIPYVKHGIENTMKGQVFSEFGWEENLVISK